jgi:hypothetical protein
VVVIHAAESFLIMIGARAVLNGVVPEAYLPHSERRFHRVAESLQMTDEWLAHPMIPDRGEIGCRIS